MTLYRASGPVTLIGGGSVLAAQIATALALAPEVIGADGGGDTELPPGHEFRAVIGDMDSLRDAGALRGRGVALHEIADQNSTDLQKCLTFVEAPLFIGLGFLGGRLDHHLAAMNTLVRNPGKALVLVGREDICFLCPEAFALDVEPGTRAALFPMGETRGILCEGLRWSVEGLDMAPDGQTSTSNEATGPIRIRLDRRKALMILPVAQLGPVARILAGGEG